MARYATRYYPNVRRAGMRWILVDAAPHILPELGPELAAYARERLQRRGVEVHVSTRLESAVGGVMRLSDGATLEAETLVWTTGVKPDPLVSDTGFSLDERGRIVTDEYLRVRDTQGAWAAGDSAAIPDVAAGVGTLPPTAQHAVREARRLALNLAAALEGNPMRPFRYRSMGSLATLGLYKGVALVGPLKLRGFPAWFIHRTYHLTRIPTLNRKVRVVSDWTLALLFRRDIVQLGALQDPRRAFVEAVRARSART
jgi:NADH dehydrogenase